VQGCQGGSNFFKSIWSYFDIIYFILNTLISLSVIIDAFLDITVLRILEAIFSIVIVIKLLYFMQLIDQIAPLVNMIILILGEFGWFITVFVTLIFAVSTSYYLIG
jgi:heme/copper-type cytochrome/quinol oxidase subunit 4